MKADRCIFAARLVLVIAVAASLPVLAQDKETRDLSGFDSIEIGGGIDLVVRQGQGFSSRSRPTTASSTRSSPRCAVGRSPFGASARVASSIGVGTLVW